MESRGRARGERALAWRGPPTFDELDAQFSAGSTTAQNAYALAYRALVELAALDTARGLAPFFTAWKKEGSLDRAIRATYGITLSGFEQRWRQRTRRRYGALGIVGNVTLAGLIVMLAYFRSMWRDASETEGDSRPLLQPTRLQSARRERARSRRCCAGTRRRVFGKNRPRHRHLNHSVMSASS
jgi:hypothetical protein